jgi:hypothetical protein
LERRTHQNAILHFERQPRIRILVVWKWWIREKTGVFMRGELLVRRGEIYSLC